MKIKDAVAMAKMMKPCAFDDALLIFWIGQLDGKIAADLFHMAPVELDQFNYTEDDGEYETLVAYPHDDLYVQYLAAKIDEANGEYNKYQNQMEIYNSCYNHFARWLLQTYEPANGYVRRENKTK